MLEHIEYRPHCLPLGIHVHMSVELQGRRHACVPGKLLHDLWMHAVHREGRQIRVAKLVMRPPIHAEAAALDVLPAGK